jgi:serine/threonine protein phosphatase PrpC
MGRPRDDDTIEILMPLGSEGLDLQRPFSSRVRLDIAARTDPGKVRPNNEDAFIVFRSGRYLERLATSLSEPLPERFEEMGYAFVVADGMGGAASGEVASDLAIRAGVSLVLSATKWSLKLDDPETRQQEIHEACDKARRYIARIHATLIEQSRLDPKLAGMGTTFTAAYSVGSDLFTFHVGDSRAYLWRHGALRQLTRDDTLAQHLADTGSITQDEVVRHQWKHVLTEALGGRGGEVHVQVQHLELQDGDVLMLCSDGLSDMVDDAAIAESLAAASTAQAGCDGLMDLALQRGGRDNVTVVVARYVIPYRPAADAS